ncbi:MULTISPECIES: hypothetical protein [unclassified Streptomyces]|uniref:hypothetical protein n=1 Tax=unclassified Streptomyces TaxID=2593676 RepID=UPI001EF882A5|nr:MULTISPECIES: hypothetical protein [unclassified Streptomyces]
MPETETVETDDGERKYTGRVFPYRDPETLDTIEIGEGIITVGERERIIRTLESRTFVHAGKRRPKPEGTALLTGLVYCAVLRETRCAHRGDPGRGARLADLEDARYVRGEFSGAAAVERYNRLSERLRGRVDGLRGDLHRLPMPSVDVSPMLDGVTLREAWTDATNEDRRERLSLAIDRVEVNKGVRGQRIIPEQRIQIHWAEPAGTDTPT